MSLEFTIRIDALKVPQSLASSNNRFVVTWSAGKHAEGSTDAASPIDGEVQYRHEAHFRTSTSPNRLLQLNVLHQVNNDEEREPSTGRSSSRVRSTENRNVGVLVIDLNAHVPKIGASESVQRATLAVSLCPVEPPIMIRVAVESVRSHIPFDEGDDQDGTNAPGGNKTRRSVSRPGDSSLLQDDVMEVSRLRAAVQSLTSANRQLRDENTLLRTALQKARDEPSYSYVVDRKNGKSPRSDGSSPVPSNPHATTTGAFDDGEQTMVLRAEVAVLQRGLQAAKEKIRNLEDTESELRAEIASLTMTNSFQLEDIQRLEQDVARLAERQSNDKSSEENAELRKTIAEVQAKSRVLAAELKQEELLRQKLSEDFKTTKRDLDFAVKRREQAEYEGRVRHESQEARRKHLENLLEAAQVEIEKLHKYGEEANQRCHSIANIVTSQAKIIEHKNDKVKALQNLLEAQQVLKKHLERAEGGGSSRTTAALTPKAGAPPQSSSPT